MRSKPSGVSKALHQTHEPPPPAGPPTSLSLVQQSRPSARDSRVQGPAPSGAHPSEPPPIPNQIQVLCTRLMPYQGEGSTQKRGVIRWGHGHLRDLAREDTETAGDHILRAPREIPLGPGRGAAPALGIVPSCSRLASCWRIRAVFSRAGDMSELHRPGHKTQRQAIQTPATSIRPGAQWRKTACPLPAGEGRSVLLFTSFSGLCSCYIPPPKAIPSPRGFPQKNSVGL